jgi:hypothetical protein
MHILFDVPYVIKSLPKILSSKGMSYVLKKERKKGAHEGP